MADAAKLYAPERPFWFKILHGPHTLGEPLSFGQVRAKGERKERVLGSLPLSQRQERTALGQHSDSRGERQSILGGTVSAHEMSASPRYLSCHSEKPKDREGLISIHLPSSLH